MTKKNVIDVLSELELRVDISSPDYNGNVTLKVKLVDPGYLGDNSKWVDEVTILNGEHHFTINDLK